MRNLFIFWAVIVLLLVITGCGQTSPAADDAVNEFFGEPSLSLTATPTPATAATIIAIEDEVPTEVKPLADAVITAELRLVDDGDGDDATFALDIVISGLEGFDTGATSFQIFDVITPACTTIFGFEDGSMIGRKVYPFITNGKLGRASGKGYNARFGGYGAAQYALHESGTLYRLFFQGTCTEGAIVLDRFDLHYFTTYLPHEPSVISYEF